MVGRSVEHDQFTTTDVAPGEIVVSRGFTHPRRGRVQCPAAVLLLEHIRGSLPRVRTGDVRPQSTTESRSGNAILFTASYVDYRGRSMGFGAAAHTTDEAGIVTARESVRTWSAAIRTRRVLLAEPTVAPDATKRSLATVRARMREYVERGDTVLVVGRRDPRTAEVIRHASRAVLVSSAQDIGTLDGVDPDHASYVVVPGIPIEDAAQILAVLRSRFRRLRGQHPGEFDYAASDEREALRSVAASSDLLLICGSEDEADAAEQVWWARSGACPPHHINGLERIKADWLPHAATVGVTAHTPAGKAIAKAVVTALSGLGPLAVMRRSVTTEPYDKAAPVERAVGRAWAS